MESSSSGMGSDLHLEVGWGGLVDNLVGQYHRLESDVSCYREPVEVRREGSHGRTSAG